MLVPSTSESNYCWWVSAFLCFTLACDQLDNIPLSAILENPRGGAEQ